MSVLIIFICTSKFVKELKDVKVSRQMMVFCIFSAVFLRAFSDAQTTMFVFFSLKMSHKSPSVKWKKILA